MRQRIHGVKDHPEETSLKEYSPDVPEGTYTVQLDYHAWGKSTNLFCYFTDTGTGAKYRLSVFSRSNYQPYNGDIAFDQEEVGGVFEITTALSKNGLPKFLSAQKVNH